MSAVDVLLSHTRSIELCVDRLSTAGLGPEINDVLSRGIAVHGFSSLEAFMRQKVSEWSGSLTLMRVSPGLLPEAGMRFGNRLVEVLPRALRDADLAIKASMIKDIGRSLTSLSSPAWESHPAAFQWAGSNAQSSDVDAMLSILGFEQGKVWGLLTQVWQKLDPKAPSQASLKSMFDSISLLRHTAAHEPQPNLPIQSLSALPEQVRTVAACFDTVGSWGVRHIGQATNASNAKPPAIQRLKIRSVQQFGAKWPEFGPAAKTAYRRHPDLTTAMHGARTRAKGKDELVVARNSSGELVDWSFN